MMRRFLGDARNPQIAILMVLLFAGVALRDWTLRTDVLAATLGAGLLGQIALVNVARSLANRRKNELDAMFGSGSGEAHSLENQQTQRDTPALTPCPVGWDSLKSGLIASLSICLLLRTNDALVGAFAALSAIFSKAVFRVQGKHFFNPSNFGIIAAVVLTRRAWISPGQWGSDVWVVLLISLLGGLVTGICGRWDTTVSFLAAYGGLEALRNAYLGWTWDVFWHRLHSGGLLVFAFLMITDPRAIPNHRIGRILFATLVGGFAFYLRNERFMSDAVFWALFAISPITPLIDRIFVAPRYRWLAVPAGTSAFRDPGEMHLILPSPAKMNKGGIIR